MIIENLSELELYCNLIKNGNKGKVFCDEEMIKELKKEFNIYVDTEDLKKMRESNYQDELLDKEMIYNEWK